MPNNDDDLSNLSIDEINALFSDIIEFPGTAIAAAPGCFNNPQPPGHYQSKDKCYCAYKG